MVSFKLKIDLKAMDKRKQKKEYSFKFFLNENLRELIFSRNCHKKTNVKQKFFQ